MKSPVALVLLTAGLLLVSVPSGLSITADLVSPSDAYTSTSGSVLFECNATDETAIVNITLFVWNSTGSLYYSNTTLLTDLSNQTNWTVADITPGNYLWNCLSYDSDANSDWGVQNRSLHANLFYLFETCAQNDNTEAIALGDLDNDGDLDYIAANYLQPDRVYLNNGTGNFTLFESTTESYAAQAIALGDLDNDGDLDYIVGNYQQPTMVYLNNGSGHFTFHENTTGTGSEQAQSIVIADIDNDGDLDYVSSNIGGADPLQIYKNDGTAHFTSFQNRTGSTFYAIALGDLNGDSYVDIAAGGYPFQSTTIYLNNGSGYFISGSTISSNTLYTSYLSIADLNRDSNLDIIEAIDRNFQANGVFINNGSAGFSLLQNFGTTNQTYSIGLGDLNDDSYVDAIAGNYEQNNHIFLNNGSGHMMSFEGYTGTQRTVSLAVGDLDNDGDLDYIAGHSNAQNQVFLNRINSNNYVNVVLRCKGGIVNKDCVGVKVNVTGSGGEVMGYEEVAAPGPTRGGGLGLHFGLPAGTSYTLNASFHTGKLISCTVQAPLSFTLYDNGTATGGVTCVATDSPPEIAALYPVNASMLRTGSINFSCSGTDDSGLLSATLYVWNSSGALINQSSSSLSGISDTASWLVDIESAGDYDWNCIVCDDLSSCVENTLNYTLTVLGISRLDLRLVINNTSSKVYLPEAGEMNSSDADSMETNPSHFFASTYAGDVLSALVFSGAVPVFVSASSSASTHTITLEQNMENSRAFLAFTRGGWKQIDERMQSIETGSFLSNPRPSFSYGLGRKAVLGLVLSYSAIDLIGNLNLHKGTQRIVFENNGTSGGKPSIVITQ